MAHKNERIDAKRFYIEENLEVPEISKRVEVPEATIYRWKAADAKDGCDWDKEREAIGLTSFSATKSMLAVVVGRMAQMVEEIKTTKKINSAEVYAIRQLMLSAKALQKDVDNYGNVLLMMSELTEFLSERDPETLQLVQPLFIEFGNAMSKKYGKKR